MKLHSPQFEKALRRRVKQAVRSSRELKRERRAARKLRSRQRFLLWVQAALFLVLGLLVWTIELHTAHPITALSVITLWALGLMIFRTQAMLMTLFASSDLHALILLPIPETTIFQWQLQKFLRGSFPFLLHFLAGFSVVAWTLNFSTAKWIAVALLAILSWAVMVGTSLHCAARLPRLPYRMLSAGVLMLLFGLILGKEYIGTMLLNLLDHNASTINLLLPTRWPVSLFNLLLRDPNWIYLVLLLPIAALLWPVKGSIAFLGRGYQYKERVLSPAPDLIPGAEPLPSVSQIPDQIPRVGATVIEEVIRSGQFLSPSAWHNAGWFESILWRWFNDRERALSDFVFPNGLAISRSWQTVFRNLAIGIAVAFTAGIASPSTRIWLLGIGLFITVCHALALLLVTGRAFQLVISSGVAVPMYASLGIGLGELAALLIKCSAVQIPLLLPFTVISSTIVVWQTGFPLQFGLWFGLKIAVLLLAARFIALTFGFSGGTNDTCGFRFRTVGLVLSVIFLTLAFGGLGVAGLFVSDQLKACAFLTLAVLDGYAVFRVYAWFYNANRFDLLRIPQR